MKVNRNELLEQYFPEAVEKLKELVSFKSYADEPQPNAPFGIGNQQALEYSLKLAKELGFSTYQDPENRYGFFEYGSGEKLFVILCHLDVVPAGNYEKWMDNPFKMIEHDGRLIGSGIIDDKGPTMMNVYALKYLKDQNFNPDYKIRLVFGLAEETSWKSIRAYVDDFGNADLGYTPDGEFPLIYAEKSYADLDFVSTREINFEINGGDAYNVINDLVTYKGPYLEQASEILKQNQIPFEIKDQTLTVHGKTGHGSLPYIGINAATWLGYALHEAGMTDPIIEFLAKLHLNFDVTNFLPDLTDETGSLTQNVGIVRVKNGSQQISINYRIPVFADREKAIIEPLTAVGKQYGFEVIVHKVENSVYVPKDSALVKTMMDVYQDVTGDFEKQPVAMGGGTYAKLMPNVVAFGPQFDLKTSTMHSYNEGVSIEDLKNSFIIYTEAIVELTKHN